MGAHQCRRCKYMRAPSRRELCNVCWLIEDLHEEHQRGEHDQKVNPSCEACRPRHRRELREGEPGMVVRQMIAQAKPLTPSIARFLLRLDRDGFVAAVRHGPKGSKMMRQLELAGHITTLWSETGCPSLKVSARSRFYALELLAQGDSPAKPIELVSGDAGRPKRAAQSHASCTHERTPKARAKCRAERAKGS